VRALVPLGSFVTKRRATYGVVRTKTGGSAEVRNRHIADMIEDLQSKNEYLVGQIEKSVGALKASTIRLKAFDDHPWTKIGRLLRVGLPR
jgi:hypothetical protein